MGSGARAHIPLVEVVAVSDTFVSGIGEIEFLGGNNVRFTLYSDHKPRGGETERHVVAKIVMSIEDASRAVRKTINLFAEQGLSIGEEQPRRKPLYMA